MQSVDTLKRKIESINERDYGAYQSLLGEYNFQKFRLVIHQAPKDPYAPPHTGVYRIRVNRKHDHIIDMELDSKLTEIAFRDFLSRCFFNACAEICKGRRGTGFSGIITINKPSQCILERNCVVVENDFIEVRCFIGLPAAGRKVKSSIAYEMLVNELPEIINRSLYKKNMDLQALINHIHIAEDSEFLRREIEANGFISFIPDNAVLPRSSGASDKPMDPKKVVLFKSPPTLQQEFNLPHTGQIKGMAIPRGVTLIAGGGYHGKSTLLDAIKFGIYNHIPGDGRELCVSIPEMVKVRAYSGRYINNTNISPFINNLPFKKDTQSFTTENASGSTSQAANIMEAIEIGAKALLMDEDTCATNFMIRDKKMQQLVTKNNEPITTYIDRVRQIFEANNISTILVLGGAGDYFDVADHVIQMNHYKPLDVTPEAHQISDDFREKRKIEDDGMPFQIIERCPLFESIDPLNEYGKRRLFAKEVNRINFGRNSIDLTDLEQLIELAQTKAICFALDYSRRYMDRIRTLKEIVELVVNDIDIKGLDVISEQINGNFAAFRSFEMAFALNRMRGFMVIQKP